MQTVPGTAATQHFGALLRTWRNARRLSQMQLSLDCEVSQRHLSFLESGRSRPSRQMVLQLSEALSVPLRNRNALLEAAGFAPAYRERELDAAGMEPVRDALTRMIEHHEPYPAVVVNRQYDILDANAAFGRLLGLFGDVEALWRACCGDGPRNLLRLTFHPQGARPLIRNFEDVAPLLLERVRRETLAEGGEAHAFVSSLREDPSLPAEWHVPDPASALLPVLPLEFGQGDAVMRLFSMISTFGTPHDVTTDEVRVELFFPADAATEQTLRALV